MLITWFTKIKRLFVKDKSEVPEQAAIQWKPKKAKRQKIKIESKSVQMVGVHDHQSMIDQRQLEKRKQGIAAEQCREEEARRKEAEREAMEQMHELQAQSRAARAALELTKDVKVYEMVDVDYSKTKPFVSKFDPSKFRKIESTFPFWIEGYECCLNNVKKIKVSA